MKHYSILLAILLAFISNDINAQGEYLSDADFKMSAFGGPLVEFSVLSDELAVSSGLSGAVLFNQAWFLGGYSISSASNISTFDENIPDNLVNVSFDHRGFWTGYFFQPKRLVHIAIGAKAGWGNVILNEGTSNEIRDNLFAVTPQLSANLNIARWFRLGFGAGYRLATGVENQYYTDEDFTSPVGTLTFKFGWFGQEVY